MLETEGGEGVGGDGAHDEEQVEEREGQQHVVERVLAHLLAEKKAEAIRCVSMYADEVKWQKAL